MEVDEGQMSQVIRNIIINTDEAMPEGGLINVNDYGLIEITGQVVALTQTMTRS